MFKNLRLKYRILLGYSIPLLLSVVVAIVVYENIRFEKESWIRERTTHGIIISIKDWEYSIVKLQRAARGYLLMKNEVSLTTYEEGEKEFQALSQTVGDLVKDPKQQERLHVFIGMGNRLNELTNKFMALEKEDKHDEALKLFHTGDAVRLATEIEQNIEDFEKRENEILKEREQASEKAMNNAVTAVFLGSVLSAILALAIGLWIATNISKRITVTTNDLAATSTEIAATVSQHERTAIQQAAMVNETTTTMEELGSSANQISEQAGSASMDSQKAVTMTREGNAVVEKAVDAMNILKEKISIVADQILRLGEQTVRVGNIADMVKDLASEINMLALNAAVEAARAGEHGKGFAVVASEVRKLAVESKKSAEQTNAIIAEIQKATNSSIMKMEEGTKTTEEVTRLTQNVGELFNSLSSAADRMYENTQQVLLNAKQQSAAIGQVIEAISSINTGAKETAAGITQTKAGIERLDEAAQNLKKVV